MVDGANKDNVSVVVSSYRRPAALTACVHSILDSQLRPSEIIIIGRHGDRETEQAVSLLDTFTEDSTTLRSAWVTVPGHIPPVETGARMALGNIVAIVDDDVTVHSDWLARLVADFSDPTIGVVGGRAAVPGRPLPKFKGRPGKIAWYGKTWGNVASVNGASAMDVDTVMECNWAWRRELLSSAVFDPLLNFDDASMYGLDLCFQARRKGYRIIYDPRVAVDHHLVNRTPELDRADRPRRVFSYCRNYTYIMLKNSPLWQKAVFLGWTFLIGERQAWGVGALMADTLTSGVHAQRSVATAFRGKAEGVRLWLENRPEQN